MLLPARPSASQRGRLLIGQAIQVQQQTGVPHPLPTPFFCRHCIEGEEDRKSDAVTSRTLCKLRRRLPPGSRSVQGSPLPHPLFIGIVHVYRAENSLENQLPAPQTPYRGHTCILTPLPPRTNYPHLPLKHGCDVCRRRISKLGSQCRYSIYVESGWGINM